MIDKIWDIMKLGGSVYVETHIIDGGLVLDDNWVKLKDDYQELELAQFYMNTKLAKDSTNAWAPSQKLLEEMFANNGFKITHSWKNVFRGGLVAKKINLPSNHPRFLETSNKHIIHKMNNK